MNRNRRSMLRRALMALVAVTVVGAVASQTKVAEAGFRRRRCRTCG